MGELVSEFLKRFNLQIAKKLVRFKLALTTSIFQDFATFPIPVTIVVVIVGVGSSKHFISLENK